jgi:hypothetical protein
MPRKPIDYSNTHFYKLCCRDPDVVDLYIGHTTDFTKRKHLHKSRCCNPHDIGHNGFVYRFIRENGHWENWDMILVETIECSDALDARRREREFVEQLHASLNKQVPTRSHEEYRADNKAKTSERMKLYNAQHAERIKEYRAKNRERYLSLHKQYKLLHKDRLSERHVCDLCNGKYTTQTKANHYATRKHQEAVERKSKDNNASILQVSIP